MPFHRFYAKGLCADYVRYMDTMSLVSKLQLLHYPIFGIAIGTHIKSMWTSLPYLAWDTYFGLHLMLLRVVLGVCWFSAAFWAYLFRHAYFRGTGFWHGAEFAFANADMIVFSIVYLRCFVVLVWLALSSLVVLLFVTFLMVLYLLIFYE